MPSIKPIGGKASDVLCACAAIDSPSDLEWGEIENYDTDSDVADYLLNRDGTCDYGEINDAAEIEVCEVVGKDDSTRKRQEKRNVLPINFETKCTGGSRWVISVK